MRVRSATRSSRWSSKRRISRSRRPVRARGRCRLAQRRPCDRERVDRSDLPRCTRRASRAGHELGRYAHDRLAACEEQPLERDRHVPAVLEGEAALVSERARPVHEAFVATPRARYGQLVDERSPSWPRRQRRCVSACADRSRLRSLRSPFTEVAIDSGVPADRPQWGRIATLLSGHAGAPRTAAGDRSHAGQTANSRQPG